MPPLEEEKEPLLVPTGQANLAYFLSILACAPGFYYFASFRLDRREENARGVANGCLILGMISFMAYLWFIFTAFADWTVTYNQFISTGLVRGAIFSLYAIGLTLVYKILKLSNFAQAELFTVGGYVGLYFFNAFVLSIPLVLVGVLGPWTLSVDGWVVLLIVSFVLSFFVTAFTGVATDLFAFKPLRARKATPLILMISSVGLGIFMRGAAQFFAGPDVRKYRLPPPPVIEFGCHGFGQDRDCVRLFNTEIIASGLIIIIIIVIHLMLTRTDFGRTLRALSDNKELAEVSGINTDRATVYLWVLSAGLTGLGGAVFGAITPSGIIPFIGFFNLLLIFTAVIIGTIGHVYGAIMGAFIVGLVDSVGAGMFTLISGQPNGVANSVFPSDPLGGPLGYGATGGLIFFAGIGVAVLAFLMTRGIGPIARIALPSRALNLLVMVLFAAVAAVLIGFGLMLAAGPSIPVLSSEYSKVAVFVVLIIVLLAKPQGIFSKYA